jgi:hypothetical protein
VLAAQRDGRGPLRPPDALRQRPRVASEVLVPHSQGSFVDAVGELRPERRRGAAEHHKERAPASSSGVELEEQAVVVTAGTIDADLVVPGHLVVQGFPETASRKTVRRGGRDRDQHSDKLRLDRHRAGAKEVPTRYSLGRVVVDMLFEVRNAVRVRGRGCCLWGPGAPRPRWSPVSTPVCHHDWAGMLWGPYHAP